MIIKKLKAWQMFIISAILLFAFVTLSFAMATCVAFADDDYTVYDTIPIRADGTEGELVHPIEVSGGKTNNLRKLYLVKLPEDTVSVKFYGDSESSEYWIPGDNNGKYNKRLATFSKDDYSENRWWTINLSELSLSVDSIKNSTWYKNALSRDANNFVKQADYYELADQEGKNSSDYKNVYHYFIQIGDENSPLDVYAFNVSGYQPDMYEISFEADNQIDLQFKLGKRGVFESDQEIYYTTDGTDPTSSDSAKKYGEVIPITRSCTVQAAAKSSNAKWGTVAIIACKINMPVPVFTPGAGWYNGPLNVSIECDIDNADIYYTLDGTSPVDESGELRADESVKKYSEPFVITSDSSVKAVAKKDELISQVTDAEYHLSTGIDVAFNGIDQGVWLQEYLLHMDIDEFDSHRQAVIVVPYGHTKCSVIVSADENATLKLGDKVVERESEGDNQGKFVLNLSARELAEEDDNGIENILTVTNGDESTEYKIYCVASRYDDLPDEVVDYYVPASQYTNNGIFGCAPNRTLRGGSGVYSGSSIGNYGGYITWYYKNGVKNDSKNPYGIDFIVFGNSVDGTNEFAEPGNIMVSEDGEKWYTLAGSIHYDDNALWNQKVTYSDENGFAHYIFDPDNGIAEGTSRFLYPDKFYYSLHGGDDESFTTKGIFFVPDGGVNAYGNVRPPYPAFGYADVGKSENCSNEAANPYGGIFADATYGDRFTTDRNGDVCDISWAVDDNGNPVKLDTIHYIKVQNASFIDNGAIGEKSTEVNCMRIAKAADSAVGVTDAPESIKIDGQEVALKADEVVDVNVSGIFDIVVDAPEDANVYINSLRSHTAFMKEAPKDIIRVIVQEGEKEPQIYYYKITQDPQPESKKVTTITFKTRTGANSNLNGLLHDKDSLTCYFDEDTVEHFGGEVRFSEATSAKESKGFVCWKDSEGKVYSAFNAAMAESGTDLALTATYADKDDAEKVKAAVALIADLPSSDKVTLEDNEAILKAKKAYDELTDEQKGFVAESDSNKLTADQNAIIKIVEDKIDALPEAAAIKTTDEEVIAAGAAFDGLTDTQKASVDQTKAEKLAAVRLALFDAFAAAIPDEVTEEQEDALAAAQAVYDSLPNDLKVEAAANYIKLVEAKLSVALEKLEKAGQQIADKQSEIDKLTGETIPALTQQLNDKIAELKTAEEEKIPALQAEIAELEQKLEKAGSDLADANAEIEELRKELVDNSIKDLIESAEKTIAAIQKDLKEAGDSISTKAIKALVETADQILDAAKTKAEEASAALAENAKEIASLREQVAKASADLAKAGEELAKAVASGKASEVEITGLKDRLAEAEAAKAEAEKAAQEALAGKQTSDEALEAAQKALKETQDELEKTAAELAALQAEIAASKFKVTGLTVTSKSRKFTVTWTKFDGADGYKVQYRKKGAKKFKNLKVLTKNKVVSKKLKKGISYQFRVRTYKMVGEKKVYGKWAKAKAVKCK